MKSEKFSSFLKKQFLGVHDDFEKEKERYFLIKRNKRGMYFLSFMFLIFGCVLLYNNYFHWTALSYGEKYMVTIQEVDVDHGSSRYDWIPTTTVKFSYYDYKHPVHQDGYINLFGAYEDLEPNKYLELIHYQESFVLPYRSSYIWEISISIASIILSMLFFYILFFVQPMRAKKYEELNDSRIEPRRGVNQNT